MKALIALARQRSKSEPLRIAEIAEGENIPRKFLEAILLELRKQGILGSRMGANGGYYLAKPAKEIMLSSVLRLTDGPIALIPCVSLNFYERCKECISEATCGLHDVALQVRDASLKILTTTSIADLVKKEDRLKTYAVKTKNSKKRM